MATESVSVFYPRRGTLHAVRTTRAGMHARSMAHGNKNDAHACEACRSTGASTSDRRGQRRATTKEAQGRCLWENHTAVAHCSMPRSEARTDDATTKLTKQSTASPAGPPRASLREAGLRRRLSWHAPQEAYRDSRRAESAPLPAPSQTTSTRRQELHQPSTASRG